MNLSRKWLNEFVRVDADNKEFSEAMTLTRLQGGALYRAGRRD
jgi:hypothetical protein